MKKILVFALIFALVLAAIPAMAADNVTVILDGNVIECKDANGNPVSPLLINGTTYLPVRAIANALSLDVSWDANTQSVFINGVSVLAKKTDVINIFINGAKFEPKDANGNAVNPFIADGTTYLPVRAIGEAFDKEVSWDASSKTVTLTSKPEEVIEKTVIDPNKTYAFINKATGKALTATDHNTLVSETFTESASQAFAFVPTSYEGYYSIKALGNGQNFDVSGHSIVAGGEIITWEFTGAENQLFGIKDVKGGSVITVYSSGLSVEPTESNTIQNTNTGEDAQLWEIRAFDAPTVEVPKAYRKLTINGMSLTSSDVLCVQPNNDSDAQKWTFADAGNGEVVITSVSSNTSVDVSGQSLNAGDPVITWQTSSDPNQRWILESQGSNTYLIKSVHSGLYLTIANDNTLIQTYKNTSLNQVWTITETN